jgi:hypothetical protein
MKKLGAVIIGSLLVLGVLTFANSKFGGSAHALA